VLGAIKPKYLAYLDSIDHRLKVLKETPRIKPKDDKSNTNIFVKGFFKEYDPAKSFQKQITTDVEIQLSMDDGMRALYGDCSRDVAQNMKKRVHDSVQAEANLEALVSLAVMELQFIHGCNIDWEVKAISAGLSPGKESDDEEGGNNDEEDGDGDKGNDDDGGCEVRGEVLDFASIDSTDVLSEGIWSELVYPDPNEFVKFRESFAMAMLMFFSEDLTCKFPALSGQVFEGWKRAFGGPITFEQLVNRPDAISTMFTNEEEDWFGETIHHFVSEMNGERMEELGITDEQLDALRISRPTQPKVKTTPIPFPQHLRGSPGADV